MNSTFTSELIRRHWVSAEKGLQDGTLSTPRFDNFGDINMLLLIGTLFFSSATRSTVQTTCHVGILGWMISNSFTTWSRKWVHRQGNGVLVGQYSSLCLMYYVVFLFLSYAPRDFRRIGGIRTYEPTVNGKVSVDTVDDQLSEVGVGTPLVNSNEQTIASSEPVANGSAKPFTTGLDPGFIWQPVPPISQPFSRLGWILDLIINVRGIGWSWQINTIPALHPHSFTAENDIRTPRRIGALVWSMITSFLILDAGQVLMMEDPYFYGAPYTARSLPSWMPWFLASAPASWLTRVFLATYRCVLAMTTLQAQMVFVYLALWPLLYLLLITVLRQPGFRFSAAMFPPSPTPFSVLLDKGLEGYWGRWWHQGYRFPCSAVAGAVTNGLGMEVRSSDLARFVYSLTAFTVSGAIHAAGTQTQLADGRPAVQFLYFVVQPVGIMIQRVGAKAVRKTGVMELVTGGDERAASWIRRGGNLGWLMVWMVSTSVWFVDDQIRGKLWVLCGIEGGPAERVRRLLIGR